MNKLANCFLVEWTKMKISLKHFIAAFFLLIPSIGFSSPSLPANYEHDCSSNLPVWFSEAEIWAFESICNSGRAEFDTELGALSSWQLSLEYDQGSNRRRLSSRFLDHVLHDPNLNRRITRNGVKIFNAVFDKIELQDGNADFPIAIERSYVSGDVDLNRFKTSNFVSFDDTRIIGSLRSFDGEFGGNLLMRDGQAGSIVVSDATLGSGADFDRTRVDRNFTIRESQSKGSIYFRFGKANSIYLTSNEILGNLEISQTSVVREVLIDDTSTSGSLLSRRIGPLEYFSFNGGSVGGQLSLAGAEITDTLLQDLNVGQSVHLRGGAEFTNTLVSAVTIGGQFDCDNAFFGGRLTLQAVEVRQPLYCRFGTKVKILDVSGSSFMDDVVFTGVKFTDFTIITRSRILGNLEFGSDPEGNVTEFGNLTLANNEIYGIFLDGGRAEDSNQENIVLEFNRITNLNTDAAFLKSSSVKSVRGTTYRNWNLANEDRKVSWFVGPWLGTGEEFEISGYNALANYWGDSGERERQIETIYLREAERTRKSCSGLNTLQFSCILRWGSHMAIGYGERPSRALYWLVFFVLVGWFVAKSSNFVSVEPGKDNVHVPLSGSEKLIYSLDDFLPVVKLRGLYNKIEAESPFARRYFQLHKLAGYILTFYVVAALTGVSAD